MRRWRITLQNSEMRVPAHLSIASLIVVGSSTRRYHGGVPHLLSSAASGRHLLLSYLILSGHSCGLI